MNYQVRSGEPNAKERIGSRCIVKAVSPLRRPRRATDVLPHSARHARSRFTK